MRYGRMRLGQDMEASARTCTRLLRYLMRCRTDIRLWARVKSIPTATWRDLVAACANVPATTFLDLVWTVDCGVTPRNHKAETPLPSGSITWAQAPPVSQSRRSKTEQANHR